MASGEEDKGFVNSALKLARLINKRDKEREDDEKKAKRGRRPMASSSSSSVGSHAANLFHTDSMMSSSLQHAVEDDLRSSSANISPHDSMPDIFGGDATMMDAPLLTAMSNTVHLNRESFSRQGFTYEVEEKESEKARHPHYQRKESDIMELSPYYNINDYPKRVCIAENYLTRPRKVLNKATGQLEESMKDDRGRDLPKTRYKFWIYSRPSAFLTALISRTGECKNSFVIVEENEPIFAYFDFDLPDPFKAPVHGKSSINLLGYALSMIRMLMSMTLCVNLLCFSDGYVVYESDETTKWSNHAHVPWAFTARLSLAELMKKVVTRLEEVHKDKLKSVAPLFFTQVDKKTKKDVETCVIDKGVFTKKRNFRVPYAKKADKSASLIPCGRIDRWNRPEDTEMCASTHLYMGLSACMILCRNSREFWNSRTVKNADVVTAREDATAFKDDFRCLPVTGNSRAYFKNLVDLSGTSQGTFDPALGYWRWSNDREQVDSRIEKKLDAMFRLLYDESWKDLSRTSETKGGEYSRIVSELFKVCRKSPIHMQAVMILTTHCYKPGKDLLQCLTKHTKERVFDRVVEFARKVGDILYRKQRSEDAFDSMWEFRVGIELAYSNTCTEGQRKSRAEFLEDLGKRASAVFTEKHAASGGDYDVRACAYDCLFIDLFISEVMIWSGQGIFVFQKDPRVSADDTPALDVLPSSDEDYEDLFRKCVYYVCTRLPGRQVDSPCRAPMAFEALQRATRQHIVYTSIKEASESAPNFAYVTLKR